MTKNLFEDFNPISAKEWKQKIQFDLKGADYNDALIYKSYEGIDVKPFYNKEDIAKTLYTVSDTTNWKNAQKIHVIDASEGNNIALTAIKKGAESIYFIILSEDIVPKILLSGISKNIPIYIETSFISSDYVSKLNKLVSSSSFKIHVLTDIIGNLGKSGNWFNTLQDDHDHLEHIAVKNDHLESTISIDLGTLQNAGASMIQQLAYGIAHANEYLNHFNNQAKNPLKNKPILFKVAIGGNYFFEIAKLRALRVLWKTLSSEYGVLDKCIVLAHPSLRNKTIMDYNVNMLRTTTECMSAIIGGADTIYNIPYDTVYNEENDFGNRIAINQLLILKNESYFDKVNNPASGSYYIESLTDQLATKALTLFKNIEKGGGYLQQLKSGVIQKKVKDSADKEQALFDNEDIILTGVNAYQNTEESLPILEKNPFLEKNVRKTLLEPFIFKKISEKVEKNKVKNS